MDWLTDADRRVQDWQRRAEALGSVQRQSVSRLPNGGLRCDVGVTAGNTVRRYRTDDVAIRQDRIDRIHRCHVMSPPRAIAWRWVMKERITIESLRGGSVITVRIRGRLTGVHRLFQFLGWHESAAAGWLADEASQRAEFRLRDAAAYHGRPAFATSPRPD